MHEVASYALHYNMTLLLKFNLLVNAVHIHVVVGGGVDATFGMERVVLGPFTTVCEPTPLAAAV